VHQASRVEHDERFGELTKGVAKARLVERRRRGRDRWEGRRLDRVDRALARFVRGRRVRRLRRRPNVVDQIAAVDELHREKPLTAFGDELAEGDQVRVM
jgi:hypothetical protein